MKLPCNGPVKAVGFSRRFSSRESKKDIQNVESQQKISNENTGRLKLAVCLLHWYAYLSIYTAYSIMSPGRPGQPSPEGQPDGPCRPVKKPVA